MYLRGKIIWMEMNGIGAMTFLKESIECVLSEYCEANLKEYQIEFV